MMAIVPKEGEALILESLVAQEIKVRLFINDFKPSRSTTLADFKEPQGNGYKPISLSTDQWEVREGNPSVATHPKVAFRFTGRVGKVMGYFMTQGDTVLSAHKFSEDEPYFVRTAGDELRISPKVMMRLRGLRD